MWRRTEKARGCAGGLGRPARGETASRTHPIVYYYANEPSRAHPAGACRKLPQAPGNPRKATVGKPCSPRQSPPIPAQPGTTKTGLSRRRSRVRVPSLP
jgi:hypothetical protein